MRSFNDWYFDLFESGNGSCLNQQEIAEEAWQHQQSKVDEVQVLYTQQGVNMLKLQKRVDAVKQLVQKYKDEDRELKLIDEWEQSTIYGRIAIELDQALKGGEDE